MFTQEIKYIFHSSKSEFEPTRNNAEEYIDQRSIILSFEKGNNGNDYLSVTIQEKFAPKDKSLQIRTICTREFYIRDFFELNYDFYSMPYLRDKIADEMAYRIFKKICRENIVKEYFPKLYSWWEKIDKDFGSC